MRFFYAKYFVPPAILLFCLVNSFKMQAQEELPVFFEPEIQFNYGSGNKWSHSFEIGNRETLYVNDNFQFEIQLLEFTHFTNYKLNLNNELGLGIRYRFREVFDELAQDEIRLNQEYENSRSFTGFILSNELKFEQRFREITSFRTRYELAFKFPLGGNLIEAGTFLTAATEALWSMGNDERPAFEHRISVAMDRDLWPNTALSVGLQYRYRDYTGNPSGGLFILAGLGFNI